MLFLHTGLHESENISTWTHEVPLLVLLLGVLSLYFFGIGPWREKWGKGTPYPLWRALSFFFGVALFYVAVSSPIDHVGEEYLFWVHMVQHILFIFPVAVALLVGIPPALAKSLFDRPLIRPILQTLTKPLVAWALFHLFFLGWHLPRLYEAALHSTPIHNLEHATMLFGAILSWWPLLNPVPGWPRLSFGARLLYIFAFPVAQLPAFGILSFSDQVFYPTYQVAPRLEGWLDFSPLEDQKLGGIIMKIAAMVGYTVAWAGTFFSWSHKHHKANPHPNLDET